MTEATHAARWLLVLLALSLAPGLAFAQPVPCEKCQDEGELQLHTFDSPGAYFECEPNDCHSGYSIDTCGSHHNGCVWEEEEQLFEQLALLAEQRDIQHFRATLAALERAEFDPSRGAISLRCGERVVLRLPLSETFSDEWAQAQPQTE